MLRQRIIFYLLCFITVALALLIFQIRFAILFVSIIAITISIVFGVIRFGTPPFHEIYCEYKHDFYVWMNNKKKKFSKIKNMIKAKIK
ncbi:MAG: hypothetical protein LBU68_00765 [Rickettsiales bacterium]|nr:hypothetical protein [Rickettsiales bacterium]